MCTVLAAKKHLLIGICIALLSAVLTSAQSPTPDSKTVLDGFDSEVENTMNKLHVPGAAVGVIEGDKIILAKGYGIRELGKSDHVTPDTMFAVGSLTKSFTAAVMAILVDQGKLEWDKPVRNYLPDFQLYDPIATQLVTPRDLLTHRSGLPRHDFIRVSTYLSREELLLRLRYLEPNLTFREGFQYNNLMYVAAGYMAGRVAGTTWEDLVKQTLFVPLGMTSSNTSVTDSQQSGNFARPHLLEHGNVKTTEFYNYQQFGIGPNGAVNSTINDFLKYLQMHLDQGTVRGKHIISARELTELHRPAELAYGNTNYALGWFVQSYHGHLILQHGGAITGFTSQVILIPDAHVGIVVFNNLESSLPHILAYSLADRFLGLETHDYLAEAESKDKADTETEEQERKKLDSGRIANAPPTLNLSAYAGDYFHPAYGTIHVVQDGQELRVKFDALELQLKHYNFDWFQIESDYVDSKRLAQFHIDEHGEATQLLLPLEPTVKPFVFTRK